MKAEVSNGNEGDSPFFSELFALLCTEMAHYYAVLSL